MIELRHLRHFVMVAEELHFARAAERLGIEQSPLSQSIRNLESSLGTQLFTRTTRRTYLTVAGSNILNDARRILADVEALSTSASRLKRSAPDLVRLAIGEDVASGTFTVLLKKLQEWETPVQIEIREALNAEALRLVKQGAVDCAITYDGQLEAELQRTRAWSEPLLVLAPTGHRLSEQASVDLADLATETVAIPSVTENLGYTTQVKTLLKKYGVKPAGWRTIRSWNTAAALTVSGHAISLCPVTSISHAGTVALPIRQKDAELVTWLFHHDSESSPAVELVLELAREASGQSSVAESHFAAHSH